MKVMRYGVFETNSSSTHSITIKANKDLKNSDIPAEGEAYVIYPGEFGWGPSVHSDAITKASYCLTFIRSLGGKDSQCRRGFLTGKGIRHGGFWRMLRDVIMEYTGAKEVEFRPCGDSCFPYGHIDHESWDTCLEAFETKESLGNFIFNPESVLIIDNDNH